MKNSLEAFFDDNNDINEAKYKDTPLDDAYDLLKEAHRAKSKKKAIELALKAYNNCPQCFDALLFLVDLETDSLKLEEMLNNGLSLEKERLEKENYFIKDNIGNFYSIYETRPYIRGLLKQAEHFAISGKIKQSIEVCKEILKLNKNDNLGSRYLLIALYAYMENEREVIALYRKYSEDSMQMLFPVFILYYKLSNYETAIKYLEKLNISNPNILKLLKGKIQDSENIVEGYYSIGKVSEVEMYFERYAFLFYSVPYIREFILKYSEIK